MTKDVLLYLLVPARRGRERWFITDKLLAYREAISIVGEKGKVTNYIVASHYPLELAPSAAKEWRAGRLDINTVNSVSIMLYEDGKLTEFEANLRPDPSSPQTRPPRVMRSPAAGSERPPVKTAITPDSTGGC